MSTEAQVNVEQIMQEIRRRVRRSTLSSSGLGSAPNLSRLEIASGKLEAARLAIGQPPPSPDTLRGRIGSVLVAAVRRMLFWYTPALSGYAAVVQENLKGQVAALFALSRRIAEAGQNAEAAHSGIADLRTEVVKIQEIAAQRGEEIQSTVKEIGRRVEGIGSRVEGIGGGLEKLGGGFENLGYRLEAAEHAMEVLRSRVQAVEAAVGKAVQPLQQRLQALEEMLRSADQRGRAIERDLHRYRANAAAQECRISVLFEEFRRRVPDNSAAVNAEIVQSEDDHWLDALYCDFEDVCRGTRDEIRDRARVYLPYITRGGAAGPVLDIGCGRGEWLELLRSEGIAARGIDSNRIMVSRCREHSLDVAEADALVHLRTLPDGSLAALTGFHIVEHLPPRTLLRLLDETVRVLRSGGVAIFETPNPANTLVGSRNFYFDPTHRNPLPSELLTFLVEARGLCRVEVLFLHPYPEGVRVNAACRELAERFNELFYGPQDYAVIGFKT
jgi:O-antigen chain-terminating methyltransferase